MPRKARIDAPGALHHIIVRGIERRKIFYDDIDSQSSALAIEYWVDSDCNADAKAFNRICS